jgi:hypothetical protein
MHAAASRIAYLILPSALGLSLLQIPSALADPPMCDENCTRRCQACKEVCVWGRCKTFCSPPEPTCLFVCGTAKATACAIQGTHKNEPLHGNYCGYGNKSAKYRKPGIDPLDEACKRHDKCYDRLYPFNCTCDRVLAQEAKSVADNPLINTAVREKAVLVHTFFSKEFCLP